MTPTHHDHARRRLGDRWHVGREIPLAIIGALAFQTVGAIWWLSQLSFKIDSAIVQIAEYKLDRYTKTDAIKDRELFLQLVEAQKQRDAEHDRRIAALEKTVDDGRKR